jgi:hypothetical protein
MKELKLMFGKLIMRMWTDMVQWFDLVVMDRCLLLSIQVVSEFVEELAGR